jgi:hypothetical protein
MVSQWLGVPWWNRPGILLLENAVDLLSLDDGQILELLNHVTDTAGFVPSVFRTEMLEYGSRSPRGRVCIVVVRHGIFEALGQLPAPPRVSREPSHQNLVDIMVPSVGRSDECKSSLCEFTSYVPYRSFTDSVMRRREPYAELCIGANDRGGSVAELLIAENLRLVRFLRGAPHAGMHLVDTVLRVFAPSDTAV